MRIATRHVVSVGKRSLAIIIPKKWVSLLKIKKSDNVILRLNRDGSITIHILHREPIKRGDPCKNINGLQTNFSSKPIGDFDRLLFKEDLVSSILNSSNECDGEVSNNVAITSYIDNTHRSYVLDLVEEAFEKLYRYLLYLDNKDAEEIHEIEYRMDLIYYSSIREVADELIRDLFNELDSGEITNLMINIILTKISEDLIDSIDRISWRINEMKISSNEIPSIIKEILDLFSEVSGCVVYPCGERDIKEYFNSLSGIRSGFRSRINSLPQIYSLVIAEIENILNNIESLVEISLMNRFRVSGKRIGSRERSRPSR